MVVTERKGETNEKGKKKTAHSSNSQHWSLRTKRRRAT
jgi:hypothetical protein